MGGKNVRYYVNLIEGSRGKGEHEHRRRILDIWGVSKGSDNLEDFIKRVKKAAEDLFEYDTLEIWDSETEQRVMRLRKEIVGGLIVVKPDKG